MVSKMSKSKSEDCELELLNLEDVVKKYAMSFLDSDKKKCADLDNPTINWDFMHITHGETQYVKSTDYGEPSAFALFTTNFANDTPKTQTYSFRTERRTKSTCNVTFSRTYTFGASLSLKLSPPTPVIGANVGFKRDVTKEQGVSDSTEQELTWSVDNTIDVPSGFQTTATLHIKEDKYVGDFTIRCVFEGKVIVTYRNKETKEHLKTVSASVKRYFENCKEFTKDNRERPVFTVRGVCKCKYGVEQNVTLKQSKIDRSSAASADSTYPPPPDANDTSAHPLGANGTPMTDADSISMSSDANGTDIS